MGLQVTLMDGAQRVLARGTTTTFTLTAGQVYYINVADMAGASGGYDLSLVKANNGGGGRKGYLQAPHLAGDELHVDDGGHDRADYGLSRAWFALAGPERRAGLALMEDLEPSAQADLLHTPA
jgi:hypothetical protein